MSKSKQAILKSALQDIHNSLSDVRYLIHESVWNHSNVDEIMEKLDKLEFDLNGFKEEENPNSIIKQLERVIELFEQGEEK